MTKEEEIKSLKEKLKASDAENEQLKEKLDNAERVIIDDSALNRENIELEQQLKELREFKERVTTWKNTGTIVFTSLAYEDEFDELLTNQDKEG